MDYTEILNEISSKLTVLNDIQLGIVAVVFGLAFLCGLILAQHFNFWKW